MHGFYYTGTSLTTAGSPTAVASGSQGTANYLGGCARVHTNADNTIALIGGGETFGLGGATAAFGVEKPELQGASGELMYPLQKYSNIANSTGKLGTLIDWWYAITSSVSATPAAADTYGSLQYVALGPSAIWPWDGSTTPVIA
jgi:hypothetical protein